MPSYAYSPLSAYDFFSSRPSNLSTCLDFRSLYSCASPYVSSSSPFSSGRTSFDPFVYAHPSWIRHYHCRREYRSHHGCVNCLSFNTTGTTLLSGSDDTRLILWDYPTGRPKTTIDTGHSMNIFGCTFVSGTNDHILASGAMDHEVRLHYAPFTDPSFSIVIGQHEDRVKDVISVEHVPKLVFSVGEDGIVRQFDLRAFQHQQRVRSTLPTTASPKDLHSEGTIIRLEKYIEINGVTNERIRGMGIDIHPLKGELIALACGDNYTRVYDRRMCPVEDRRDERAVTKPYEVYTVPHLHDTNGRISLAERRRHRKYHGTSIQYSPNGEELLVNYHQEHIYLFHTKGGREADGGNAVGMALDPSAGREKEAFDDLVKVMEYDRPIPCRNRYSLPKCMHRQQNCQNGQNGQTCHQILPNLQDITNQAQAYAKQQKYTLAIDRYIQAIALGYHTNATRTEMSRLYQKCSACYKERRWRGDSYVARWACQQAMEFHEEDSTLHYQLLELLENDRNYEQLATEIEEFQAKFQGQPKEMKLIEQLMKSMGKATREKLAEKKRERDYPEEEFEEFEEEEEEEQEEEEEEEEEQNEQYARYAQRQQRHPRESRGIEYELMFYTTNNDANYERLRFEERERSRERIRARKREREREQEQSDLRMEDEEEQEEQEEQQQEQELQQEQQQQQQQQKDKRIESTNQPLPAQAKRKRPTRVRTYFPYGINEVKKTITQRFIGYCNVQTDIKEAKFLGEEYIVAGSDDGYAYIWERRTGKVVRRLKADNDIVNCVAIHPLENTFCTSGIENVIRLWEPTGEREEEEDEETLARDMEDNQVRMKTMPSLTLLNMTSPSNVLQLLTPMEDGGGCTQS